MRNEAIKSYRDRRVAFGKHRKNQPEETKEVANTNLDAKPVIVNHLEPFRMNKRDVTAPREWFVPDGEVVDKKLPTSEWPVTRPRCFFGSASSVVAQPAQHAEYD